jgi:hypothetical protein
MRTSSSGRRQRLVIAAGLLALALAAPSAVSADTTGGVPSIPPASSRDATISIDALAVTGKVIVTVQISVVCQPFQSYDWDTGQTLETTDGSLEYGNVTILQAQGRTLDYGSADVYGAAVCDGSTVNRYTIPVSAAVSPWRTGAAVMGAQVYIADRASFQDSDAASSGPISVRLSNR